MPKRTTRPGPSLDHLLQTLRDHLPELRDRYHVKSLGVFGSYVRGEQRPRSDLDLLVEFEDPGPSLFGFLDLQEELTDLLTIKVDLVEKKGLKPYIGRRVLQEVLDVSETVEGGHSVQPRAASGVALAQRPEREIRDYLHDILENSERVQRLVQGTDFTSFSGDWQQVYAVLYALMTIGEAVRQIPTPLRQRYPEVPWRRIVGLRNVVAHVYFGVELPRIWRIIHEGLPPLRAAVARMLADLDQGEHGA